MGISYLNFKVPHGMALQPHADGTYHILYDSTKIVELRDWTVTLANTLTTQALEYLEQKKKDEQRIIKERTERATRMAFPENRVTALDVQAKRIADSIIPLMGAELIESPTVSDTRTKSIPPKIPLTPSLEPRKIDTVEQGIIIVAGDVSDEDIQTLGFTIVAHESVTNAPSVSKATLSKASLPNGSEYESSNEDRNTLSDA